MIIFDLLSVVLLLSGAFFFFAGTVGLLRFPDVYTRLHASTKADNLGLGLIAAGLIPQAGSFPEAFEILLIWMLVLISSATACYLIAGTALKRGIRPWRRP